MEQTQDKTTRIIILALLVVVAIFSRFLPHPPNFTAVGAVALFAGAHFHSRLIAFAIPLIAMLASDLIIGLHDTLIGVYAAFTLTVGIGLWISEKKKAHFIALGAVSASVLFFIITNFAVWMSGLWYPMSFNGLLICYTTALPFFQNTLAGDLFFTALLFGTYHLVNYKYPNSLMTAKVKVKK